MERVTAPNRRTRSGTTQEEITYAVCRAPDDLAYLANQGCVTPHVWLSRVPDLYHPDQMIFDRDPASPDPTVLRSAAAGLHRLLDELELPAFLKSSGSRGLHIVVPLVPDTETDDMKIFSMAVAEVLAARDPDNLTTEGRIADRGDRLFLDIGRNGYAQTVAAPYAVRPLPGGPVSVPARRADVSTGGANRGPAAVPPVRGACTGHEGGMLAEGPYVLKPIGRVESPLVDRDAAPKQGDEGSTATCWWCIRATTRRRWTEPPSWT